MPTNTHTATITRAYWINQFRIRAHRVSLSFAITSMNINSWTNWCWNELQLRKMFSTFAWKIIAWILFVEYYCYFECRSLIKLYFFPTQYTMKLNGICYADENNWNNTYNMNAQNRCRIGMKEQENQCVIIVLSVFSFFLNWYFSFINKDPRKQYNLWCHWYDCTMYSWLEWFVGNDLSAIVLLHYTGSGHNANYWRILFNFSPLKRCQSNATHRNWLHSRNSLRLSMTSASCSFCLRKDFTFSSFFHSYLQFDTTDLDLFFKLSILHNVTKCNDLTYCPSSVIGGVTGYCLTVVELSISTIHRWTSGFFDPGVGYRTVRVCGNDVLPKLCTAITAPESNHG